MSHSIKKRAFPEKSCSATCPVRRARMERISKLEGDVKLLKSYGLPSPKADSELEMRRYWQAQCQSGLCHK